MSHMYVFTVQGRATVFVSILHIYHTYCCHYQITLDVIRRKTFYIRVYIWFGSQTLSRALPMCIYVLKYKYFTAIAACYHRNDSYDIRQSFKWNDCARARALNAKKKYEHFFFVYDCKTRKRFRNEWKKNGSKCVAVLQDTWLARSATKAHSSMERSQNM